MQPHLILICGNVGAGKSSLAEALAKRLRYFLIRFDDIVWYVFPRGKLFDKEGEFLLSVDEILHVYEIMYHIAGYLLHNGKDVVLESLYLPLQRKDALAMVKKHTNNITLIHIKCDDAVIRQRIAQRMREQPQTPGLKHYLKWRKYFTTVPEADITLDTTNLTLKESCSAILERMKIKGVTKPWRFPAQ